MKENKKESKTELIKLMAQVGATVPQCEMELNLPFGTISKTPKYAQAYIKGKTALNAEIDKFIEAKVREMQEAEATEVTDAE